MCVNSSAELGVGTYAGTAGCELGVSVTMTKHDVALVSASCMTKLHCEASSSSTSLAQYTVFVAKHDIK